ncbi:MAG: hypothetical protein NZ528_16605 [Caldilineales bacterium]|nr:hypothetical protein [Caldilineales bacterium]MDW8316848.1 hypothetical protein [Anaerolineae bacterium]
MAYRLAERLIAASRGWLALAALAAFLLFTALVLPGQAAQSAERTGGGPQPDSSLFYSAEDLYAMAEAFGPEGRQAYIRARFTFDLVWPLVYGAFLVTSIGWLAGRAFAPGSLPRLLVLVPVLGVALDYLENLSTSLVMARYPALTPVVDVLAPLFTSLKWAFVGGSFVVLVGALLAALQKRLRRNA